MEKVKYIYVSSHEYNTAVYQTQIIDWLNLYRDKGLDFDLWHVFYASPKNKQSGDYRESQIKQIKAAYKGTVCKTWLISRMPVINKLLFYYYIKTRYKGDKKVVVFSRANIGEEIDYVKKKMGNRICFYYDLRGAHADEMLLRLRTNHLFKLGEYERVAGIAFSEYQRQKLADKIFVVSNSLKRYFIKNYCSDESKFVLYPCLSTMSRFYYSSEIRKNIRYKLGVGDSNLYVYSGGLGANWHIPDSFLRLFMEIAKQDDSAKLLVMSAKITDSVKRIIESEPIFKERILLKEAVPSVDIVKYLNAADFGILLRENNPVNNVAFPSKFAEYIMCGLPVIVSESVWDCAEYCRVNKSGFVISNSLLDNMSLFKPLHKEDYNRQIIADVGRKLLSKEESLDRIVKELKVE